MILYSHITTPRLQYIADFIGKELGISIVISNDKEAFANTDTLKINYSDQRISSGESWIKPHVLLFQRGIQQQDISVFDAGDYKAFFKTEGDFPFDIFAATFYLLSRYEEYLPHQKDMYGRYAHENSIAVKENFLNKPLINYWLIDFGNALAKKFSSFTVGKSQFTFLPTYDIDEAFAYKHKSFLLNAAGGLKNLLQGSGKLLSERLCVLSAKRNDPYNSFEWMDDLHQQFQLQPIYFFLLAEKRSIYDKNISPGKGEFVKIIKEISSKYKTGIHPSWQSGDETSLIKNEKETLEKISGRQVTASRQHYIRMTLPETYRHLINVGIKEDYSMGYGSINGFRPSVASTFYWYDLEKELKTDLLLFPFCFMEANSYYEQKQTPEESFNEMMHYYHEVKKVNGLLITLWHNTFLGTGEVHQGWRMVYEKFIQIVAE